MSIIWSNPVNHNHPLNRGLLAWYLNTPNVHGGLTFRDLMGRHHGTLIGMDAATAWKPPSRPGAFGELDFDGVDDYVDGGFVPVTGSGNRTVSAWAKTASSSRRRMVGWGTDAAGEKWDIRQDDDNGFALRIEHGAGFKTGTTAINSGDWVHVAVVLDGDDLDATDLFVNGGLEAVGASSNLATAINTTSNRNVRIGSNASATEEWDGQLDDVRIYDRALNAAEVRQLFILTSTGYGDLLNRQRRVFSVPAVGGTNISLTVVEVIVDVQNVTLTLDIALTVVEVVIDVQNVTRTRDITLTVVEVVIDVQNVTLTLDIGLTVVEVIVNVQNVTVSGVDVEIALTVVEVVTDVQNVILILDNLLTVVEVIVEVKNISVKGLFNDPMRIIKRAYYSPAMSNSIIGDGSGPDRSVVTVGALQVNVPVSIGFVGIDMLAGEFIAGAFPLPWDFDPTYELKMRIHFTATGSNKDMTWVMLANLVANGDALIAHSSLSVLDTPIALDLVRITKGHNVTPWGVIDNPSDQVTRNECRDGALFQFRVESDILGAGLSLPTYYGIELGYIPMFYTGPGSFLDETQLIDGTRL